MECFLLTLVTQPLESWLIILKLNGRNEAGILTARKDLDYIGREELLEALKRVSAEFTISCLTELTLFVIGFPFLTLFIYFL